MDREKKSVGGGIAEINSAPRQAKVNTRLLLADALIIEERNMPRPHPTNGMEPLATSLIAMNPV